MKRSKFSDSQIMAILKQDEKGVPIPELCRDRDMSMQHFTKDAANPEVWILR